MKVCSMCHIGKDESEFRVRIDKRIKYSGKLVYLSNRCYECEAKAQKERTKRQRATPEGKAMHNRWAKEFHKRHREKVLIQQKERRNRAGAKQKRKEYDKAHKQRIMELGRKRNKKYIHKMMIENPEKYAARELAAQMGVSVNQINGNTDLIKAKSILIQFKRKIKNHGN